MTLRRGDHVRHPAYPGVALWFVRHPEIDCDVRARGGYCDCGPDDDTTRAIVVMVGDEGRHTVDTERLEPIDADEFCGSCGQIGCGIR